MILQISRSQKHPSDNVRDVVNGMFRILRMGYSVKRSAVCLWKLKYSRSASRGRNGSAGQSPVSGTDKIVCGVLTNWAVLQTMLSTIAHRVDLTFVRMT